MTRVRMRRVLIAAAWSALVALALMTWSFFDGRPIASVAALTLGQGLGTLSFACFVAVVIADLRRARILPQGDDPPHTSLAPPPRGGGG